jgi:hypothetical protein
MIIILIILIFISFSFLSVIKYQIEKRSEKTDYDVLDTCKVSAFFSLFILVSVSLFLLFPALHLDIKEYNKYYFKEKNKTETLILENNIFSGTIIKWWTKDYPKIK